VNRPYKNVHPPACIANLAGSVAEFRISVIPIPDRPIWQVSLIEWVKEPNIEIFYAISFVLVVQSSALTQGNRERIANIVQAPPFFSGPIDEVFAQSPDAASVQIGKIVSRDRF